MNKEGGMWNVEGLRRCRNVEFSDVDFSFYSAFIHSAFIFLR